MQRVISEFIFPLFLATPILRMTTCERITPVKLGQPQRAVFICPVHAPLEAVRLTASETQHCLENPPLAPTGEEQDRK